MTQFFHGWRRKAGCVTLALALAMLGAMIRSRTIADWCYIPVGQTEYEFISEDSQLKMIWWMQIEAPAFSIGSLELGKAFPTDGVEWECMGIQMGHDTRDPGLTYVFAFFPYLSLILPATLLSACLILWKPRKSANG